MPSFRGCRESSISIDDIYIDLLRFIICVNKRYKRNFDYASEWFFSQFNTLINYFYIFQISTKQTTVLFIMKSPMVIITALLPLATQLALANPVAADSDSSLEEREGGHWNDKGKHWGDDHEHPEDWCKVKKTYWYHKYPCDSSGTVGESKVGDTFAPVCKYQYGSSLISLYYPTIY